MRVWLALIVGVVLVIWYLQFDYRRSEGVARSVYLIGLEARETLSEQVDEPSEDVIQVLQQLRRAVEPLKGEQGELSRESVTTLLEMAEKRNKLAQSKQQLNAGSPDASKLELQQQMDKKWEEDVIQFKLKLNNSLLPLRELLGPDLPPGE